MSRWLYYTGCFFAAAVLSSLPRFLFETQTPSHVFDRGLLLLIVMLVAWFFSNSLHENWRWSVLSSVFIIETISAVTFAVLLFLQLFSYVFAYVVLLLIFVRILALSYTFTYRFKHLRGLVFFTILFLLVCGELVLVWGANPINPAMFG